MALPAAMRRMGVKKVVIVHAEGTEDESRTEVEAHIQAESGFFGTSTPIYEGDIVEVADPRGGIDRRLAAKVNVNDFGSRSLQHTQVFWGSAPAPRTAPVRRLSIENLHPEVMRAASDLFADGHFAAAVQEAYKSIDLRVKKLTGLNQSGTPLMGTAFSPKAPLLDVARASGTSGQDEREGFVALFRGAMLGVRNPNAHELLRNEDPQEAIEYLGFASLLHRRLDFAETKLVDG